MGPFGVALALACGGGAVPEEGPADGPVAADTIGAPVPAAGAGAGEAEIPADAVDARWTSGDTHERRDIPATALLRDVRTARHEGFDRIVFEFEGDAVPGHRVSYIDRPVRQCGSGDEVPFAGDAWLSMVFEPSDAHTQEGRPTIAERTRTLNLPNIIELKMICDFEAQVEWVAGVHAPMEYRVLTLGNPARIVVDVRHPASRR